MIFHCISEVFLNEREMHNDIANASCRWVFLYMPIFVPASECRCLKTHILLYLRDDFKNTCLGLSEHVKALLQGDLLLK